MALFSLLLAYVALSTVVLACLISVCMVARSEQD